jgi:hypothetical protein
MRLAGHGDGFKKEESKQEITANKKSAKIKISIDLVRRFKNVGIKLNIKNSVCHPL